MRIDEIWIYLLAAATTVVLVIGLAQVLEDPRRRLRRERSRRPQRPPLEPLTPTARRPVTMDSPPALPTAPPAEPEPDAATGRELAHVRPTADLEPEPGPLRPVEQAESEPTRARPAAEAEPGPAQLPSAVEPEPGHAQPAAHAESAPDDLPRAERTPGGAEQMLLPAETSAVPPEPRAAEPPPVEATAEAAEEEPRPPTVEEISEPVAPNPLNQDAVELTPLDKCLTAYETGDHAGAIAAAEAIARPKGNRKRPKKGAPAESPAEQAAAWAILGLARRGQGNRIASSTALESASRWAADVKRSGEAPTAPGLEARLGRQLLASGEAAAAGSEARRLSFRLAATWLGWALASDAADADLSALRAQAVQSFDAASERRVADLMARRDFAGAQRPIEEALASGLLGAERGDAFRDLFWTRLASEVGQLIGEALRAAEEHPPGDPMAKLAEAKAVVDAVPKGALSPERTQDLARRIWWAQTKLGTQRMEAGDYDGALDLLFRCLELAEGDAEREAETRQALSRTVGGIVEQLGEGSLARLRDGDIAAALAESRRLSETVDRALQGGLTQADLAAAIGRRQEIMLQIAEADRG